MKAKYFIWDFDGTIIDTYPHSTEILVSTMREYGIEIDYSEAIVRLRSSFSQTKKHYNMTDEMFDVFLKRACTLTEPHPVPYEGVYELLDNICKAGGKNFLYTHRDKSAIEYLKMYDLLGFFTECITTESEQFCLKPRPDSIEYLVKKYNLPKELTVMVGDREIDVLSGKNAGCGGILFDERSISAQTEADATVTRITDISDFIA